MGSDDLVVSRRFVIIQSAKPLIDDLKESGSTDARALHDVDYVAWQTSLQLRSAMQKMIQSSLYGLVSSLGNT